MESFGQFNYLCELNPELNKPLNQHLKELKEKYCALNTEDSHTGPKLSPEYKESFLTLLLDKIDSGVFVMESMKGVEAKKAIIDAFGTFLDEDLTGLKKQLATPKQKAILIGEIGNENTKTFDKYLLHKDNLQLANALKTQFSTEKGKAIRLLIEAMKENNPPVLAIATGEKKAFYEAMLLFFGRDIGKYTGIFDYVIKESDSDVMEAVKTRLNYLLEQLK